MSHHLNRNLTLKLSSALLLGCLTSISVSAENTTDISDDAAKANTKTSVETNKISELYNSVVDKIKSLTQATVTKVEIDENSFSCIREMTPVRHFYVDNLLGDIDKTLEVANAPKGKKYPVGSVVQLVPTEAMVKLNEGSSPATGDWEFFELAVDTQGTKIGKRGFVDVKNRFDGNCFTCHAPAREQWDFICESGHGCEPIPIDHSMTGALQRSDPRCGPAVPEDGDAMALFKLKAMVAIGSAKKWFEELF